ncbi:unnamed protein product [marine sediment metagenome]|uniref:Uncharacterized protein n=1 Tax=marine sediment metagenome TaxID=412755 RepID=X1HZF3_9ZZZZ
MTISWSGFVDGWPVYISAPIGEIVGYTASGSISFTVPSSWLGTYTLIAEQPYVGSSNTVTFTVVAAAPPPPPEADGKVYHIDVQDKARGVSFTYHNGVWNRQPEVTVGNNLYISACAVNQGAAGNLTLTIKDDTGAILSSATVTLGTGAGFCIGTGTINMPNRSYSINCVVTP